MGGPGFNSTWPESKIKNKAEPSLGSYQVYRLRSASVQKVMLKFLLEFPVQLHYIAKQGYYIFSRATKISKLVALLATNDLHRIFTPREAVTVSLDVIRMHVTHSQSHSVTASQSVKLKLFYYRSAAANVTKKTVSQTRNYSNTSR